MSLNRRIIFVLGLLGMLLSACSREVTLQSPPISDELVPKKALAVTDNERWQPVPGLDWQVQFTTPIEAIPGIDVYDLDLFDTSAEDVATLHAQGAKVVCYINMGAWEDWRPDADAYPQEVIGRIYAGWPGERWLDIRQMDLLTPIMSARLDQCVEKGFDGVEPDNLDGYTNQTGFPLTFTDQLTFNRWVADAAHTRELAVGLKNDPDQVVDLVDWFDWALLENCLAEGWCEQLMPFINEGKPVVMIEYSYRNASLVEMCPFADALGFDAMIKDRGLNAWREGCP
jgi:hypothetical protein